MTEAMLCAQNWAPGKVHTVADLGGCSCPDRLLDIWELRILQLQELCLSGNHQAGSQEVRRPSNILAREEMNPSVPYRLSW